MQIGRFGGTEQQREEHFLGPHNAMDGFVRRVAQRADGKRLGSGLGLALKALGASLDVDADLQRQARYDNRWNFAVASAN